MKFRIQLQLESLAQITIQPDISELFIHLQYIIFQYLKRIVQYSQQVWESTNTILNTLNF